VQVVVDYVAVVMCLTDSLDERRPRRAKSTSLTRSARFLAHHDHRCRSTRFSAEQPSTVSGRRDPPSPAWSLRRPGIVAADCCRNGRPTTRSSLIDRDRDDVRGRPATTDRRPPDDGAAALAAAGFSPTLMADVREVRRLMTALQTHFAAKDAVETVARDWRLVATCLDRALFCVYCVVVAVSLTVYFPRGDA